VAVSGCRHCTVTPQQPLAGDKRASHNRYVPDAGHSRMADDKYTAVRQDSVLPFVADTNADCQSYQPGRIASRDENTAAANISRQLDDCMMSRTKGQPQ